MNFGKINHWVINTYIGKLKTIRTLNTAKTCMVANNTLISRCIKQFFMPAGAQRLLHIIIAYKVILRR